MDGESGARARSAVRDNTLHFAETPSSSLGCSDVQGDFSYRVKYSG